MGLQPLILGDTTAPTAGCYKRDSVETFVP